MKVKSKIVARYEDKGRLKAAATVCLGGKFLVTGVRVADCQKGLAVFMPSREIRSGEYRDICFPISSELHKQIKDSGWRHMQARRMMTRPMGTALKRIRKAVGSQRTQHSLNRISSEQAQK